MVIQGRIRQHLSQNYSSTFVYGIVLFVWMLILVITWRHNVFIKLYITQNVLLCYGEVLWFFNFKTFWPKYNLDLRSYGHLLSLFYWISRIDITFDVFFYNQAVPNLKEINVLNLCWLYLNWNSIFLKGKIRFHGIITGY